MVTVGELVKVMERLAPRCLAETWDNPGLHVGSREWPVKLIWVALDPTQGLIQQAVDNDVNLVITHHPLIFRPLYSVDPDTQPGRIIELALKNQVAVLCAHTNLDSARGGVNDMLAEKVGLRSVEVLKVVENSRYKAVIYIPVGHETQVLDALFESGLGEGKKYSCLSFRSGGTGTFLPGDKANPFLGTKGERTEVQEFRVEIGVDKRDLVRLQAILARVHPYEEVVYDLYPVHGHSAMEGLGRIGNLPEPISFEAFVNRIKREFALSVVKSAGNPVQDVRRVAVCGGSGRSLISDFLRSDADVLISGDMGYHDGQQVADVGKGLIDIGHFSSEHVMVEGLARQLSACLASKEHDVAVVPFSGEKDCFRYM